MMKRMVLWAVFMMAMWGFTSCSNDDDEMGSVNVSTSAKCKNYNATKNKMDCVLTATVTGCNASDVKQYEWSTCWTGNSYWSTSSSSGGKLSSSITVNGTVNKKLSYKVKVTLTNGSSISSGTGSITIK